MLLLVCSVNGLLWLWFAITACYDSCKISVVLLLASSWSWSCCYNSVHPCVICGLAHELAHVFMHAISLLISSFMCSSCCYDYFHPWTCTMSCPAHELVQCSVLLFHVIASMFTAFIPCYGFHVNCCSAIPVAIPCNTAHCLSVGLNMQPRRIFTWRRKRIHVQW